MKYLNTYLNFLNETPDKITYGLDQKTLLHANGLNYTFGYYKKTLLALQNVNGLSFIHNDLFKEFDFLSDDYLNIVKNINAKSKYRLDRDDLTFSGRLFTNAKIISFWKPYPSKVKLNKILNDLSLRFNIDFSDWFIDMWKDLIIPISDYNPTNVDVSLKNMMHLISPMKKQNIKKRFGKNKKIYT